MFIIENEKEFKHILQGSCIEGATDHCSTIRNILCSSPGASKTSKREFESKLRFKKEQEQIIRRYSEDHQLQLHEIPGKYLTQGGESKIYLQEESVSVIKLNDGGYYSTWFEFFNSILLHNLFFPDTYYKFIGIYDHNDSLHIALQQPFIISNELTSLNDIKKFLEYNNFVNIKRQDYYSMDHQILLEDLHDENVITRNENLFFIDTVFYLLDNDYFS